MKMNSQTLIAVDANRLDRLEQQMAALTAALHGATVIPRPEWVRVSRAAELLNVSPSTIRRQINLGQLEAKGNGKARRVRVINPAV
jgi:Helix-turn-helix domain